MMLSAHDDVSALPEDSEESPYRVILTKSQLARDLKTAYLDLKNSGSVHLKVHSWIEVSFCLPKQIHHHYSEDLVIDPEIIQRTLTALRPYHGMLLLVDVNELLESLPYDSSPALFRLIKITNPLKSLQRLSADADLALPHVFQLVGHLVYWAKAMIIYPLCESNVYVLSPHAPTNINCMLNDRFAEKFPGVSLLSMLSQFSLPISLSHLISPLNLPQQHSQQVQMVVWMLQHRLLMQLHTYIYLMCTDKPSSFLATQSQETNRCPSVEESLSLSHESQSGPEDAFQNEEMLANASEYPASVSDISSKDISDDDLSCNEKSEFAALDGISATERANIMSIPAASNSEDLKLFVRLCRYFHGHHHLEEIMYYENVRRSQLLALLDKFREVLVTAQHEDAAVAAFYPNG